MKFTSYSHNFEDVMLWRALKHIKDGFYIDVGAQHPILDSVSKMFYERGWRGVHIEPVPEYAELLRKNRPDETVLEIALSDVEGVLEFNIVPNTGLSTAVTTYAQQHYAERVIKPELIEVRALTLSTALMRLAANKEVHWLKIDVEGFEEKVLQGWDYKTLRPWIVVIEATIPNSPALNYLHWDPLLIEANYHFVYFDGLNRFYLANEHSELKEAFSCPPNVFDNFELTLDSLFCRDLSAAHQLREQGIAMEFQRVVNEFDISNQSNIQAQAEIIRLKKEGGLVQARISEAKTEVECLKTELDVACGRVMELKTEIEHSKVIRAVAEARIIELETRVVEVEADLKCMEKELKRMEKELKRMEKEKDVASARVMSLEVGVNPLKSEYDLLCARMALLSQELEKVYLSKSWKITWPLRKIMLLNKSIFYRIKFLSRKYFSSCKRLKLIVQKKSLMPKERPSLMATKRRIAIDLLPLIPGGANGGAKVMILELIKNMSKIAQDYSFVLLTSNRAHEELAILDTENVERFCVLDQNMMPTTYKDILEEVGANLLFCPFIYSRFANDSVPTVSIIHDIQYCYYPQFFDSDDLAHRGYCFTETCKYSNRIVSISNYVRETIIQHAVNVFPGHVVTIPCVIPLRLSAEKNQLETENLLSELGLIFERFLLYPANFWQHKNHEVLLIAFSMHCAKFPNSNLKLVLTGHPCERKALLENAILKMKLSGRVIFLNYVDNQALALLMSSCFALVFPSLYEGFGIPILEAMSCGRPVLCGNVSSMPEVASEAAILFDPRKPGDIQRAIEQLESSELLRNTLIQKGYARMNSFPSSQEISQRYLSLFSEVFSEVSGL